MASNTKRLGLLKKDPVADGNDTFNIKTMLNDNWDAIDAKVAVLGADGKVPAEQLSVAAPADASTTLKGVVMLEDSVTSTSIMKAATANAVKIVNEDIATHKADDTSHVRYGTASGTNAKTITLNPKPTSLVEGMAISFKNTTANSGAVTLNINSLGAKPVIKSNGNPIAVGNLRAGGVYTVRYDGTSFVLQGEGASGNATASDLLSGKTASTDAGDIVGTIPNKAAQTFTPSTTNQTINAGQYLSGAQIILGESNLLATNIKNGVDIFGVVGNYRGHVTTAGDIEIIKGSSVNTVSKTYVKIREFTVNFSGAVRVRFGIGNGGAASSELTYGKVYINDVPVGSEVAGNASAATFLTQDFNVNAGDRVQFYCRAAGSATCWLYEASIRLSQAFITQTT